MNGAPEHSVHNKVTMFLRESIIMAKQIIQNNFGSNKFKTVAPQELQPTQQGASDQEGSSSSRNIPGLNDEVMQRVEDLFGKPGISKYQRVEVDLEPHDVFFSALVDRIHDEILRVSKAIAPNNDYMSRDEVENYLHTLLWMRVEAVSETLKHEYRTLKNLMVHPFYAVILDQIGLVRDTEFGLDFVPVIKAEMHCLTPVELLDISDRLQVLEPMGFAIIPINVSKDRSGTLEFMSLQHIEGVVKGLRVNHSVYGFLGAMFANMAMYQTVGLVPPVMYGYDSNYRTYLSAVFSKIGKQ